MEKPALKLNGPEYKTLIPNINFKPYNLFTE